MSRWIRVFALRLRSLFLGGRVDRDLNRELRFHLDEHIDELVAQGWSRDAARAEAMREFGSPAVIAEQCRDTRRVSIVSNVWQDFRYACRTLAAQPMLVMSAAASIALGIGANLTIFGLASDLLLSSPTAQRPDQLVHIRTTNGSHTSYRAWQIFSGSGRLAGIAGHRIETDLIWRGSETSVAVMPLIVTANFFDVMGVPMAMGRGFTAAEAATERDPRLAVVSHGFWTTRLGSDPAILGKPLILNGEHYTVIGVLPADITSLPGYGLVPHLWLPLSRALLPDIDQPNGGHLQLIGRLHDGQDASGAFAALATLTPELSSAGMTAERSGVAHVSYAGGTRQLNEFKEVVLFFGVLLVVTSLILAIACANVAGLLLARARSRGREIAIRLALGATRGRIVQQLLTEGFVLSLAGMATALVLVAVAAYLLRQVSLPLPVPIEFGLAFDTRLGIFAGALVLVSTLLSGLAPALQATRPALVSALKQDALAYVHRRFTLRNLLVTGQVAVSGLLLVVTVLFLRNLALARTADPGFDVDRTLVAQVTFVEGRQGSASAPAADAIIERLRSIPGVTSAAFSEGIPLTMRSGGNTGTSVEIEGRPERVRVDFDNNSVSAGYFDTMGIKLVRGRDFTAADRIGTTRSIVVNESFVRRYFDGLEPIGRHIFIPTDKDPLSLVVVGVVADSKYATIGEDHDAALYSSYKQDDRFVHVIARTSGRPDTLIMAVRDAIQSTDQTLAVTVEPMASAIGFAFIPSRVGAALVGALGLIGGLLAMIGLYGVVAFSVSRRTGEIGVRMALGATRRSVIGLVIRDCASLAGVGIVIGLVLAALVTKPLAFFLVSELPTFDPISFVTSGLLLVLTSLGATISPARRATRVQPSAALRAE
jgi:putative ABC transport system permease protein